MHPQLSKIKMDYDATSVIRVYDAGTGKMDTFTGQEEAGTLFTGLFAALRNDTEPSTLAVKHLEVHQDGDFSHVFLVWECPGAGFEKVRKLRHGPAWLPPLPWCCALP